MSGNGMLRSDQAGGVPSICARMVVVTLVVAWFLVMVVAMLVVVLECA